MKELPNHKMANKGRYGDNSIAHVADGEMMIPPDVLESRPDLRAALMQALMQDGMSPERYTVGGEPSINPETGLPEYWGFKSFFKKFLAPIISVAAPVLLPGIGAAGSALLGAGLGAATGGGVKGALLGAASGGLAGGGGSMIANAAGLTGAAAKGLSGALTGAATGLAGGGGLKGALLGSALGGAGGYALGGGIPSLGNAAGTTLAEATGNAGLQGATEGSGIIGNLTKGISNIGGGMTNLQTPMTLLSGLSEYSAQGNMEDEMKAAQERAAAAMAPYSKTGEAANLKLGRMLAGGTLGGTFSPGDLTKDPGYQFRLQQGQQALERSQAARGGMQSGAALKAAQEYGQGLADQTYGEAYQRWLQGQQNTYGMLSGTAGRGQQAAQQQGVYYDKAGDVGANATLGRNNALTRTLSTLARGNKPIIGYDWQNNPIYGA